jgi:hypothetical protein
MTLFFSVSVVDMHLTPLLLNLLKHDLPYVLR